MKTILIFLILTAAAVPVSALEIGHWWRLDHQYRLADGRMAAVFELITLESMLLEPVEVYYRLTSYERTRRRSAGYNHSITEIAVYHTVLQANPPTRLEISAGKNTFIELWAKSDINGQNCYAQTVFALYGNGGNMVQNAQKVTALPNWPHLRSASGANFYRAQVETPLNLNVIAEDSGAVQVFKNGIDINCSLHAENGSYTFTPPYDAYLSKAGARVKQDYIFVTHLPATGDIVVLTVPVYRGYMRRVSYAGGLTVFGLTLAVSLGFIFYKRRKFPYR